MKLKFYFVGMFALVTLVVAAPRTWVLKTGETVSGDYVSSGTTTLVVKIGGTNCFLKISDLTANDQTYVAEMKIRAEKDNSHPGDIMYYSSILGVWTNASGVFQTATTLYSSQNSPSPLGVSKAKDLIIEVAKAGYVPAEIKLGDLIASPGSAEVWANKNNVEMGMYQAGGPAVLTYNEAASWYQMAAERGSAEAQCKLAHLFQFNVNDWFFSGHYEISIMNEIIRYYNSPHIAEAAKWYGMAAERDLWRAGGHCLQRAF